ncbi:hypothetical protein AMTR_s00054p00053120, partial [Amborella trichopoda]
LHVAPPSPPPLPLTLLVSLYEIYAHLIHKSKPISHQQPSTPPQIANLLPHHNPHPTLPLPPSHSRLLGPFSILVGGRHSAFIEKSMWLTLVGHFKAHRGDTSCIEKWCKDLWAILDLSCRRLSSGDILFSFPLEQKSFSKSLTVQAMTFGS